ncbi:SpaA isopeptide-forming pilin-related protein [Enterococcus timonensis]|uniref:SpaA isopeptide-forming pilin-related protein n=1 Tax=Enterococcus timonensis TaxID=1852364 RepID=UPI0008DA8B3A|nr:SpaA isopeptide-forming pilin-related protein [Enterococcus timonensis]
MNTTRNKKGLALLMLLGILIPYLTGMIPAIEVTAKTAPVTVMENIVDAEEVKADVSYEVSEYEIQWEISYEKKASSQINPRRLKVQIDVAGTGLGSVRNLNYDGEGESDGWYVLGNTYSSEVEEGVITFATDLVNYEVGEQKVHVTFQVDEKIIEEVVVPAELETQLIDEVAVEVEVVPESLTVNETENFDILAEEVAGPHEIALDEATLNVVAPGEVEEAPVVETPAEEVTTESSSVEAIEEENIEDSASEDGFFNNGSLLSEPFENDSGDVTVKTFKKDAYLTDWDKREYRIDIEAEVDGLAQAGGANVILVMDVSGSMAYDLEHDRNPTGEDPSRLDILKITATEFIADVQKKAPSSQVSLVSYADSSTLVSDFLSLNDDNVTSLNRSIAGLVADGATRSDLGMELAYKQAKTLQSDDGRPLFVIFLSDGVPTTSNSFSENVAAGAQSWSSMIKGNIASETTGDLVDGSFYTRTDTWAGNGTWSSNSTTPTTAQLGRLRYQLDLSSEELTQNVEFSEPFSWFTRLTYKGSFTNVKTQEISYGAWNKDYGPSVDVASHIAAITEVNPLLNVDERIYAIQQAKSYATSAESFMEGLASSADHSLLASDPDDLKKIFDDIASQISSVAIQDTIDARFELTADEIKRLRDEGLTVDVNNDGTTTLVWPTKKVDGTVKYTTSINVRAKDKFAGGNVVPTNVADKSGIMIDGVTTKNFPTPYVNVRLLPFKVTDTREEIYWGESAQDEPTIITNWTNKVEKPTVSPVDSYPEIGFVAGSFEGDVEAYPEESVENKNTGTFRASAETITIDDADGKAKEYADDSERGSEVENILGVDNVVEKDVNHSLDVNKAAATLTKLLNGAPLPTGFSPTFDLAYTGTVSDDRSDLTLSDKDQLKLEGLAVGSYKTTEDTGNPLVAAGTWDLVVGRNAQNSVVATITGQDDLDLLNKTLPLNLEIKKIDRDSQLPLAGATFTLSDSNAFNGTVLESLPTDKDGQIKFETELEIGKTYYLKETSAPTGYIASDEVYQFTVGIDGKIVWVGTEPNYAFNPDGNDVSLAITIDNTAMSPLPSTGGSGIYQYLIIGALVLTGTFGIVIFEKNRNRKGAY